MNQPTEYDRLCGWLRALPLPMPIQMVSSSEHEAQAQEWIRKKICEPSSHREALLWLRLGLIDRAHTIVQDAERGIGAYIHGMVHRLEGDYWNAKYWFRRVDNRTLTTQIATAIQSDQSNTNRDRFDPSDFTDQVQQYHRHLQSEPDRTHLEDIALLEWQAVWEACNR